MQRADCLPSQIERFLKTVTRFLEGERATIPEESIEPVPSLPQLKDLALGDPALLSRVAIVKLNGGLGTSMGLEAPKSLLPVKDGRSFLEITVEQLRHLKAQTGVDVPLILMNSFNTSSQTGEELARLSFEQELPWEFLQSQVPKILPDGRPAHDPEQPGYEWCPPGHGDLYPCLRESGLAEQLRGAGIDYLFVSNADNLGASMDLRILHWMDEESIPFLMEVTRRTEADKKGGHLATGPEGLLLRESAQCPEEARSSFSDIEKHRFFNTNNLWLSLACLDERLDCLPLIVNRKPLRPDQPESQPVIQLESAMGAAIGCIPGAQALEVSRRRFAPVKTTTDLLKVRSDLYRLDEAFHLESTRPALPPVSLDSSYKLLGDFERAFGSGPPSLKEADALVVEGFHRFGKGVIVRGEVRISQADPELIPAGTVLTG